MLKAAAAQKRAREEAENPNIIFTKRPADRFETLVPINYAGRRCLETEQLNHPSEPILVVCADASGGLGVLEPAFRFMELPCFALDILQDESIWHAENLHVAATTAARVLDTSLPFCKNLIICGIGLGGLLAHALCVEIEKDTLLCCALVLLEGSGILPDNAAAVDWIDARYRDILCLLSAQAYDMSVSAGRRAVSKEAIVVRLSVVDSAKEQLRLLGMLCPRKDDRRSWAVQVEAIMLRFAIYRKLASGYVSEGNYSGQGAALLQREWGRACYTCLERGGPDKVWAPILPSLEPIALFVMPGRGLRIEGWSVWEINKFDSELRFIVRLQDKSFRERAHKIIGALLAAEQIQARFLPMGDVIDEIEFTDAGSGAVHRRAGHGFQANISLDAQRELHDAYRTSTQKGQDEVLPSLYCTVLAINREARAYIEERTRNVYHYARGATPASESSSATGSIRQERKTPLFMFHTECGEITQGQRALATHAQRPVFALALGPDALLNASSLEALSLHYYKAIISTQPHEPYMLIGTGSLTSAALAHATAMHMQRAELRTGMIFADCAVTFDATLEAQLNSRGSLVPPFYIPDAVAYGLYYFLTDIGTLHCTIADFAEQMHGTFTPWEQLLLLDGSRPPTIACEPNASAAWDTALYAVVQRCAALKQLLVQDEIQRAAPSYDFREGLFEGYTTLLMPRGIEGLLMESAIKDYVLIGKNMVKRVGLGLLHGEGMTTNIGQGRLGKAIRQAAARMEKKLLDIES